MFLIFIIIFRLKHNLGFRELYNYFLLKEKKLKIWHLNCNLCPNYLDSVVKVTANEIWREIQRVGGKRLIGGR